MTNYNRYRIQAVRALNGETLVPTVLPSGVTEATARAVRADLNRNSSVNGRLFYRLQVRDVRDVPQDWITLGAPDPMAKPDDDEAQTSVCEVCSLPITRRGPGEYWRGTTLGQRYCAGQTSGLHWPRPEALTASETAQPAQTHPKTPDNGSEAVSGQSGDVPAYLLPIIDAGIASRWESGDL